MYHIFNENIMYIIVKILKCMPHRLQIFIAPILIYFGYLRKT